MGKLVAFVGLGLKLDLGAFGIFVVRSGNGINGDRATLAGFTAGRQLIPGSPPAANGEENYEEHEEKRNCSCQSALVDRFGHWVTPPLLGQREGEDTGPHGLDLVGGAVRSIIWWLPWSNALGYIPVSAR